MNTWFHGPIPIARFDGKTIKPMTSGLDKRDQIKRTEGRG